MSSQPPASSQPSESGVYQLPALGSRPSMTTAQQLPQYHHSLPPPLALDNQRPRLPPPSHLDPPFTPYAPQIGSLFSNNPSRFEASHTEPFYNHHGGPLPSTAWSASAPYRGTSQGSVASLPALHPSDVAHPTKVSTTEYEPPSPTKQASHRPLGRSSLFDDSTYNARPFSSTYQPRQSPVSSRQSSITSSSGQPSRALYDSRPQALPRRTGSRIEAKGKEKETFVSSEVQTKSC